MILTGKVSGYDMTYDTGTQVYQLLDDGVVVKESKSLDAIDRFIITGGEKKDKKKFKRVAVLIGHWSNKYNKGEATSIAEKKHYDSNPKFWVIDKDGQRSKEDYLLLDIPENEEIINQIKEKERVLGQIDFEITELKSRFAILTPEMMEEGE